MRCMPQKHVIETHMLSILYWPLALDINDMSLHYSVLYIEVLHSTSGASTMSMEYMYDLASFLLVRLQDTMATCLTLNSCPISAKCLAG